MLENSIQAVQTIFDEWIISRELGNMFPVLSMLFRPLAKLQRKSVQKETTIASHKPEHHLGSEIARVIQ